MDAIRIASRRSPLAVAQTRMVVDLISAAHPALRVEVVTQDTRGDRTAGPLAPVGGKGLFTAELEQALREGKVDLAVHSAKDLPADMPEDMIIAACPRRADPRDAMVTRNGVGPADLPHGAQVGTSSLRRVAQLLHLRGDLRPVPIRGNVETRLRQMLAGGVEAVILAVAGLHRAGLLEQYAGMVRPLEIDAFVPAAGQGILALQTHRGADEAVRLLQAVDHPPTHQALLAERAVVRALEADCASPVGVHIYPEKDRWSGRAMVAAAPRSDRSAPAAGGALIVFALAADCPSPEAVAGTLTRRLFDQGALELLARNGAGSDTPDVHPG